jgi:hypothetical protein
MKIRIHKGSLSDSMNTAAEIEPTREAVVQYLRDQWGGLGYGVYPEDITVEPYCYDQRIGWNIFIVLLNGKAAAFTDGPLT